MYTVGVTWFCLYVPASFIASAIAIPDNVFSSASFSELEIFTKRNAPNYDGREVCSLARRKSLADGTYTYVRGFVRNAYLDPIEFDIFI